MKIVNKGAARMFVREFGKDANGNLVKNLGKEILIAPDAIVEVSDNLGKVLLRYRHIFEINADGIVKKENPIIKIPAGVGQAPTAEAVQVAKKGK